MSGEGQHRSAVPCDQNEKQASSKARNLQSWPHQATAKAEKDKGKKKKKNTIEAVAGGLVAGAAARVVARGAPAEDGVGVKDADRVLKDPPVAAVADAANLGVVHVDDVGRVGVGGGGPVGHHSAGAVRDHRLVRHDAQARRVGGWLCVRVCVRAWRMACVGVERTSRWGKLPSDLGRPHAVKNTPQKKKAPPQETDRSRSRGCRRRR